jgi:di/tricarboxylate transporter
VSLAALSLAALVAALVLSMTTRINVGVVGLALAWAIGVYGAGLAPEAVMAGFPISLFLTLAGVTLLFAIADANGTLGAVAARIVRVARGDARVVPVVLFFSACALSSVGPGAIATVALLVPLAMIVGRTAGVPPLLTALMVANGANAGNLSPFSTVGIIANGAMAKAGLAGHEWRVWFANFAAHILVAGVAYGWLAWRRAPAAIAWNGGLRLRRRACLARSASPSSSSRPGSWASWGSRSASASRRSPRRPSCWPRGRPMTSPPSAACRGALSSWSAACRC